MATSMEIVDDDELIGFEDAKKVEAVLPGEGPFFTQFHAREKYDFGGWFVLTE